MGTEYSDRKEWIPGILSIMITIMVGLAALTPYIWIIPEKNMTLITQAQTVLYSGWMFMLGYYFGTSNQGKKAADTISTMATTAQLAGSALVPLLGASPAIPIEPGQTKTIVGTGEGS